MAFVDFVQQLGDVRFFLGVGSVVTLSVRTEDGVAAATGASWGAAGGALWAAAVAGQDEWGLGLGWGLHDRGGGHHDGGGLLVLLAAARPASWGADGGAGHLADRWGRSFVAR